MTLPVTTVEIAFSTGPNDPAPVWVDVTQWWRVSPAISITRGRQDEQGDVSPSKCTLTLDNSDGRFTAGNVNSPYYPNVKKGRRIRVSETWDGTTYRRFTGYVDSWPVTWADASATVADAAISASSRLARLAKGTELRSIVEEEYLQDDPAVYYTFGDAEGTTQAGNVSATTQPFCTAVQVGSGGGITFGTATGPSTDGMTAAQFSPANQTNGFYMRALFPQPVITATDTTLVLECFFLSSTANNQDLVRLNLANGLGTTSVLAIVGNKLRAASAPNLGANIYLLDSAASVNDGLTHHAMVTETLSGGNLTAVLYLDGVQVATSTIAASSIAPRDQLAMGGSVGSGFGMLNGVLSHVAVTGGTTAITAARALAHATSGLTGFSGERSDQRIDRLATYAGVPAAEVATETGLSTSIVNQVTNGKTALALMSDVVATESGVLFDARDGTLTFHGRGHRYGAATAMTLAGEILAIEPGLDDQGLVNDITVNRDAGVTVRIVDEASIDDYGLYRDTVTLLTTLDSEVQDAASWKVGNGATPLVRIPVAQVDLGQATSSQRAALLALEIGDRVTLANLPSQAPAASMDFFVEGYTEQISSALYQFAFNLSPAALSGVWVLDSAVYSVLDSTTRLGY